MPINWVALILEIGFWCRFVGHFVMLLFASAFSLYPESVKGHNIDEVFDIGIITFVG